jgi:phosphate-selective porin OprO and OprP
MPSLSDAPLRFPRWVRSAGCWWWLTAVLLAALFPGGTARADERDAEIAGLKARLERLEKLCERLATENDGLKTDKGGQAPAAPRAADAPAVREIVAEYLKDQERKKKEADEEQKKKAADKGFVVGDNLKFDDGSWRNGLQLESADKAFRFHVGGRMHVDGAWWEAPDDVMFGPGGVGPLEDGAAFRRARLRATGTIFETVNFFTEYGFELVAHQFFDVFGEVNHLPYVGTVRVGHFREPFSMDALTSGNFLTLMERSLIQDAFVPFRNTGIMAYDTAFDEQATWAVGAFRSSSNVVGADGGDGDYALTSRVTVNPWYAHDGACALHLGVAGSIRDLPELNAQGLPVGTGGIERVRLATRPEIRPNAPFLFADTGVIAADSERLVGLEFGLGLGRFLVQAEYVLAFVDDAVLPAPGGRPLQTDGLFFHGGYVQASYFLTGEFRPYVRNQGAFGQVVPHEDFFCVEGEGGKHDLQCGRGAWEVAARYSYIDLDNHGVNGGMLNDLTLGLNWYLNRNARVMSNYLLVWRDAAGGGSDGLTQILAGRFQVDF